ncbi:MAG: sensor histidine kinase, partial [Nitrospinae bacterium]|nr:sensor histidine kinase [Nitrospinota bacterium]
FTNLVGLKNEDIQQKKTYDFYHDRSQRDNIVAEMRKKGFYEDYEVNAKKADGTLFWVVGSTRIISYKGEMVSLSGFYEITKQKEDKILLEKFSQELVNSQETERKRISRELHDSIGQNLLSIVNEIKRIIKVSDTKKESIKPAMKFLSEITLRTYQEVREISHNLRPPILDELGLEEAVKNLSGSIKATTDIQFTLNFSLYETKIPNEIQINLYRIIQESLLNILKHSKAKNSQIDLEIKDNFLIMTIKDDGKGFTVIKSSEGIGIIGMEERVKLMQGEFTITSAPQKGTTIHCTIPLKSE